MFFYSIFVFYHDFRSGNIKSIDIDWWFVFYEHNHKNNFTTKFLNRTDKEKERESEKGRKVNKLISSFDSLKLFFLHYIEFKKE